MTTIKTNAMEINLPGGETQVQFPSGYAYFWVRNDSSDTVRISLSPNISDGKDGVISIPPGSSNGTMHGYRLNDLYISGSGKVMVMGTGSAHNPFKFREKGGESECRFLTTDSLVFSLSDIEFTTYNTKVLLGKPSIYNLPLGIIPKTAEIVSKCGTQSNFLFSYGNGGNGQTFSLTQDEFVGWYNSVSYANINEARGKIRHIVCTNENKSVTIYVNGQKVVDTDMEYPCDPNDADFSLNSFHGQPSLNTSSSALYVLRFYKKQLSESEIINNYKVFRQKYEI